MGKDEIHIGEKDSNRIAEWNQLGETQVKSDCRNITTTMAKSARNTRE